MFNKLKNLNFKDKKVLVRVDFNVPITNGIITDDSRIKKTLPTLNYILSKKPTQIIIISHLGRPKGEYAPEFSLKPVCEKLSTLLNEKVFFESNPKIRNINVLDTSKIVMLENLRFDNGEESNDLDFSKKLASFADLFVLDAFGISHREHASIVGVPELLPSCSGLLFEKEIKFLSDTIKKPKKPFVAIIGGAKADKIDVITLLLEKVDTLIIGGVLANTFLKAKGQNIGNSKYDNESLDFAKKVLLKYPEKIALPVDYILGKEFSENTESKVAGLTDNLDNWMIMDIGPYTITGYKEILKKAKTIIWAGPIGVFEFDKFKRGTWDIANTLAETKSTTIIGGGDSASAIINFGLEDKMSHVSTGGGASLAVLSGEIIPGLNALEKNYDKFK